MRITTKTKKLIKKVGVLLLCVIAVGLCASVVLGTNDDSDSDYKTTRITWDVGGIRDNGDYNPDEKCALYTVNRIDCTGAELYAAFNSSISYEVHFYDEDDVYISSEYNDGLEMKLDTFPEGAVGIRIVLRPLDDEDDKIGLFEKYTYANQLTVKLRTADAE